MSYFDYTADVVQAAQDVERKADTPRHAICQAILAERHRCASQLEEKALLMRGSVTGNTMARIFEAEAVAMRNAHTLAPTLSKAIPSGGEP